MCGITGIFGLNPDQSKLESMLKVALRRGPESASIKEVEGGLLGHTLLAFVREGNNLQPLVDGNSVMIYNGEVYNWESLNAKYDLGAANDTETLLKGLKSKGIDFLKEIDGQFAFIAQIEGKTVVARDKWGISPVVYGKNTDGELVIGSTPETVEQAGVKHVKTVPAGTFGIVEDGDLKLEYWFQLAKVAVEDQKAADPKDILKKATESVITRIPEKQDILYTAMGGIDSQFVTATVARHTNGRFGGAVTVVPWNPEQPDNMQLGDYHEAKATVDMLKKEGIEINHHVVQLTPEYINGALDRLLKVLGPDFFNVCCGLAEDLVATTVRNYDGKAVMTAGGPDEAGRSYKPWTLMHKNNLEEGFYAICDQFASSEGVRAGLVLGEHGLENRVPLAFLIEDAMYISAEQKQEVQSWGNGADPYTIKMKDKIFWRQALQGVLPEKSLSKPKETIHSASGAKPALHYLALNDNTYQAERAQFIEDAKQYGWEKLIKGVNNVDPKDVIAEGELYCLWRWSRIEQQHFKEGCQKRYEPSGQGMNYSPELKDKAERPICYDWMLA
jgi:asparagine synthetase B (glutamine-hydrolysing)